MRTETFFEPGDYIKSQSTKRVHRVKSVSFGGDLFGTLTTNCGRISDASTALSGYTFVQIFTSSVIHDDFCKVCVKSNLANTFKELS